MSDHAERISVEEELAARLTAFALGELNEQEQAELKAELAQRPASGERLGATAGSPSSADVEQLAKALRQADRCEVWPESSASLRELLESKLADDEASVELKKLSSRSSPRRRIWIAVATALSLLLVAIPLRQFWATSHWRDLQAEIAQLRAVNDRLRAEARQADDRLALIQVPRSYATAALESRDEALMLQVTPRIIVAEEEQEQVVSGTPVPAGGASDASNQPGTTFYAVPLNPQSSSDRRYVAEAEAMRGRRALGVPGVPSPTQLAAGLTARGSGDGAAESMPGNGGAAMYGGSGAMEGMYGGADRMGMDGGMMAGGYDADYGAFFKRGAGEPLAQVYRYRFTRGSDRLPQSEESKFGMGTAAPTAEQYSQIVENRFMSAQDEPLSTFSIDVDTASYANARRFLTQNQLPPANAIRIEEFINYFSYDYPAPKEGEPFSVNMEVTECPWQPANQLVRIGLKGEEVPQKERPPSNVVFLLDVSGSMQDANKLPLLKQAMKLLTDQLTESDRVSIVTYAGNAGLALDTTNGQNKPTIRDAIDALHANGSTNGSAGIQLAYEKATQSFIRSGANRVVLATDGDLNVGVTDDDALIELIKQKAAGGVFLTVLGFGEGNLKDGKLEKLADNGNGMYAYIDSLREARKVLVEQIAGSLVTIAKDVKIKVEFNPAEVAAYRLLGYENRLMSAPDFDNDAKDAGEIGAGHTVTALYEVVPTKIREPLAATAVSLKYQRPVAPTEPPKELTDAAKTGELLTLFLRYKQPDANESTLSEFTVTNKQRAFDDASSDFRFAAAVASFGMVLRNSEFRGNSSLADVEQIASSAIGSDPQGHRTELLDLVRKASTLHLQGR